MACPKCNYTQKRVLVGLPLAEGKGIAPRNKVSQDMPMMPVAAMICENRDCTYIEFYQNTLK